MLLSRALSAALIFALNLSAYAEVTVVRHFRLGESDAGAAHGTPAGASSVDAARTQDLTVTGSPLYTADVANANSTLSMEFNGTTQYATTGNWDNLTTNFGVEVWVKPASADGEHYILYNGDSAANGWGIIQNPATGKFGALFGGRATFGEGNAVPGVWTHLAIVCTDSVATFYVNGVASGTTTNLPNPATGFISIASNAQTPATHLFGGKIDEARIFTFAPGAFATSDLLFQGPALPPTLHLKLLAAQNQVVWPTWDGAFGLETSTTLLPDSWTSLVPVTVTNGVFSFTFESPGPTRFYRLKKSIEAPRLPPGQFIIITSGGNPKNVTDYNAANANRILNTQPSLIDARAFVDPADPNGVLLPLQFHWRVIYPNQPGFYSAAGMTGYFSPVLRMQAATLATQPSPPSVQGRGVAFSVEVHSPNSGLTTVLTTQVQAVGTALALSMYNDCQTETEGLPDVPLYRSGRAANHRAPLNGVSFSALKFSNSPPALPIFSPRLVCGRRSSLPLCHSRSTMIANFG